MGNAKMATRKFYKRGARSSHLPLYVVIRLLQDNEAQVCELHLKLVSDRKLTKTQKKKYKELHPTG